MEMKEKTIRIGVNKIVRLNGEVLLDPDWDFILNNYLKYESINIFLGYGVNTTVNKSSLARILNKFKTVTVDIGYYCVTGNEQLMEYLTFIQWVDEMDLKINLKMVICVKLWSRCLLRLKFLNTSPNYKTIYDFDFQELVVVKDSLICIKPVLSFFLNHDHYVFRSEIAGLHNITLRNKKGIDNARTTSLSCLSLLIFFDRNVRLIIAKLVYGTRYESVWYTSNIE